MADQKIGKYSIVGELGRGAMGIVYKALDPYIGRTVAIKTVRFDLLGQGPERDMAQKRFLREAHSAGNLSHPNIVTIYDVGEDQGTIYIAMEFIDGQSLEEVMHARTKFSLDQAVNLLVQVAEGLDAAHKKGVVHRDIKPANILLDPDGRPHIVDFGIARISTSTMTQTNMIMGTPFYMSPEQISGKRVDHRADIFALGGILYELLTGHKPFAGDSLTAVMYKIMNEEPLPVRTYQKGLPEGLDYIVSRALAKTPESRYQSCRELIHDLRNYTLLRTAVMPPPQPVAPSVPPPVRPAAPAAAPPAAPPAVARREPTAARRPLAPAPPPAPEIFVAEEPAPRKNPLVFVLVGMLVVVAVVIGVILLSPRGGERELTSGGGGGAPSTVSVPIKPKPLPESPDQVFARGQQLWTQRRYDEAAASFQKIPFSAPQYFEARLYLASLWEQRGHRSESIAEYTRLAAQRPQDGLPRLRLAELYEKDGDRAAALENYRRYLGLAPAGTDLTAVREKISALEAAMAPPPSQAQPSSEVRPQVQAPTPKTPTGPSVKPGPEDKPQPQSGESPPAVKGKTPAVIPAVKDAAVKKSEVSAEERAAELARMVDAGKRSIDRKNYAQAVEQLKAVLAKDPENRDARYYLVLAESKQQEAAKQEAIQAHLDSAKAALREGRYEAAIQESRQALALDPELAEAQKTISQAVVKSAPAEAKAMVDQYVVSIRNADLRSFYAARCTPELFQRIRRDSEVILKAYRDFQATASDISFRIKDSAYNQYAAEVSFNHIMTGVSAEKGTRQVLFEGKILWTLAHSGSGWAIADIAASRKGKK